MMNYFVQYRVDTCADWLQSHETSYGDVLIAFGFMFKTIFMQSKSKTILVKS